jgi:hypothetical protein
MSAVIQESFSMLILFMTLFFSTSLSRANHLQDEYLTAHRKTPGEEGSCEPSAAKSPPVAQSLGSAAVAPDDHEQPCTSTPAVVQERPVDSTSDAEDLSEVAHDALLQRMDNHVGVIYEAMPSNSMLVIATGQGDTADCRRMMELKFKRQGRVDGLPTWSLEDEEAYAEKMNREMQGLCFCSVKP